MKIEGNPPQWAIDLLEEVCKDQSRALPKILRWRKCDRSSSSGTYYWVPKRITIRAGHDEVDVRHVLLHEIAHHVNCRSKKHRFEGHTVRFWRKAFTLFQKFGDIEYSAGREASYKQHAVSVYERHFKKEEA